MTIDAQFNYFLDECISFSYPADLKCQGEPPWPDRRGYLLSPPGTAPTVERAQVSIFESDSDAFREYEDALDCDQGIGPGSSWKSLRRGPWPLREGAVENVVAYAGGDGEMSHWTWIIRFRLAKPRTEWIAVTITSEEDFVMQEDKWSRMIQSIAPGDTAKLLNPKDAVGRSEATAPLASGEKGEWLAEFPDDLEYLVQPLIYLHNQPADDISTGDADADMLFNEIGKRTEKLSYEEAINQLTDDRRKLEEWMSSSGIKDDQEYAAMYFVIGVLSHPVLILDG